MLPPAARDWDYSPVLKFIFWSLVAINGALFAYGQGYLGHFSGNEHEPQRMKNQLNADKLAIVSPDKATVPAAPAVSEKKEEAMACLEIGTFLIGDAHKFEVKLEPLQLGDRQSRHNLPGTEVSSYIVFIPSQGSKEGADKKAGELRALGVTNYFIMSDSPNMKWGISLGVFHTEAAAQNQLAALIKQGVRTARIAPRMSGSKQLAFQFRDVDAELKAKLEQIRSGFPGVEAHSCK